MQFPLTFSLFPRGAGGESAAIATTHTVAHWGPADPDFTSRLVTTYCGRRFNVSRNVTDPLRAAACQTCCRARIAELYGDAS